MIKPMMVLTRTVPGRDRGAAGRALRALRLDAGLSAADVAEAIDLPTAGYRAVEAGRRALRFTEALQIADLLTVPVSELARAVGADCAGPERGATRSGLDRTHEGSGLLSETPAEATPGPSPRAAAVADLTLARRMRQARLVSGLSRREVIEMLGWRTKQLAELEAGARTPTLGEALALTRLYALAGLRKLDDLAARRPTHEAAIASGPDSQRESRQGGATRIPVPRHGAAARGQGRDGGEREAEAAPSEQTRRRRTEPEVSRTEPEVNRVEGTASERRA